MEQEKKGNAFALFILQLSMGVMLAVGGIWALQGSGDLAANAIKSIFEGDIGRVCVIIFGVIELLVGIFMILKLLIGDRFGGFGKVLALIAVIVWIVAVILSDIFGNMGILNDGKNDFFKWLYTFAQHLIILGALLAVK